MDGMAQIARQIEPMLNNRLGNYIAPGLTSYLVGGGEYGKVRLFKASRLTRDVITPHSHRFDFTCLVLAGSATNTLYVPGIKGDEWCLSTIDQVCGANGLRDYVHTREAAPTRLERRTAVYGPEQIYSMTHDEIHSIEFSADASVIFFEGPQIVMRSSMIEPWVDGKCVPTFETKDWMFAAGEKP